MQAGKRKTLVLVWTIALVCAGAARGGQSAVELAAAGRIYEDPSSAPGKTVLTPDDETFLDDLQRRGIQFFLDEADPVTGLMPDRARATGGRVNEVASIASVGFGLTAICIGVERGWIPRQEGYDRAIRVIRFLKDHGAHQHGYFYHFLDMRTGQRAWNCEVSNIDTALLMAGVLTVRQYFPDTELASLANELYERVDWVWMSNDKGEMHTGWSPEKGMFEGTWSGYSECPVMVALMGMGSRTHPLPPETWKTWKRRPVYSYAGLSYVACPPLFTHQFPQCWFDLRGLHDGTMNYFRNARLATIAQRQWTIDELSRRFPTYGPEIWGLTASDSEHGYTVWGGPPEHGRIDGSVVPCAAGGSLAFEPRLCLDALRAMRDRYGQKGYVKYGFVDAFNPATGWYNRDVIGIDVGPIVLMAENCRSGFVWKTFMSSPEAQRAMRAAGFRQLDHTLSELTSTSVIAATPE